MAEVEDTGVDEATRTTQDWTPTRPSASPEPAAAAVPTPTKPSRARSGQGSRRGGKQRAMMAAAPAAPASVSIANVPGGQLAHANPSISGQDEVSKDKTARPQDNAVTARLMKTKMCYFFERGKCSSQNCRYAHSAEELRNQPNLQKTKLCKVWALHGCCANTENCVFAHGEEELRVTDGIYKTQMCHFFERGRCLKGERCNHAHGPDDLRMPALSSQAGRPTTAGSTNALPGGVAALETGSAPNLGFVACGDACRPLSPLPLADLLADSTHAQQRTGLGSPVPSPALAAAAAGFLSPDLGAAGGYVAPLAASPIWSAPWGAIAGTFGSPGTPLTCLQPLAPSVMLEGPQGGFGAADAMVEAVADHVSTLVPCDLSERLASLDLVVQDLSAEVRTITGCGATGVASGAGAISADVGSSAFTGALAISQQMDTPQQAATLAAPQRHVHRI